MAKTSSVDQSNLHDSQSLRTDDVAQELDPLRAGRNPANGTKYSTSGVRTEELTRDQTQAIDQYLGKNLTLGNYVILDQIGVSPLGHIYRAINRSMDHVVTLRILPPELTRRDDFVERFHREVKAAARLSHPNIVMTYDSDVANGLHFIVREYVEGTDLSTLVQQRGSFSVVRAVNYICQAARGLEYAHTRKAIHPAIKPDNLILDRFETVKILGMELGNLNDTIRRTEGFDRTKTNAAVASVGFMSPEQLRNSTHLDERSEIYSLGMTLCFLLTGKSAYEGVTDVERLLARRDLPLPSLAAMRHDVDTPLDSIFQKMIAEKPDDRYQSILDVIRDLDSYMLRAKPEPKPVLDQTVDASLKSLLLNLENPPAFLTSGNEELLDLTQLASEAIDIDCAQGIVSLDAADKTELDVKIFPERGCNKLWTVLGAVAAVMIAALLFELAKTEVAADRISPPVSHIQTEAGSLEPASDNSDQEFPGSVAGAESPPVNAIPDVLPIDSQRVSKNLR